MGVRFWVDFPQAAITYAMLNDWRGLKAIWLQSSGLETNPQSHYVFPGSPFLKIGCQ